MPGAAWLSQPAYGSYEDDAVVDCSPQIAQGEPSFCQQCHIFCVGRDIPFSPAYAANNGKQSRDDIG